jgi:hypothetical protein
MAGKVTDSANSMFASIGAVQTLVENFPMNLISFGDMKFSTSFDVLTILFQILGISREEVIEIITNALAPDVNDEEGGGFVSYAEEVVKLALEANIMNILNCSTNPIISNKLLDSYYTGDGIEKSGEGIMLNVAEVDFTGVLGRNPFHENDSKFYFDVDEYNANSVWKSKDFNAFLWYIINKSDKSQTEERTWTNRYRAKMWGDGNGETKEIIRCTYIDEEFPNTDKIRVQICGARPDGSDKLSPANYFKTRKLSKKEGSEWALNKTIFEFNHEFLTSIKLYDPKVIIAEIVEHLFGEGNFTVNLGFSFNEEIIQGKIQSIIKKVIEVSDLEVNDCFFSFSNEEYNDMLEKAEQNRYNMHNNGNGFYETNAQQVLDQLNNISSSSTLHENKAVISKALNEISATPAKDPSASWSFGVSYDWGFELMRMLVYPFVRPLFTPKVIFLLMVNKKIMGSLEDVKNLDVNTIVEDLMNGLFFIIKDIIVKLKDMLIDMFLNWILKKLAPLLALFTARILLEALTMYKDLLFEIFNACKLTLWNPFNGSGLNGEMDDVNYADIIPSEIIQTEPEQKLC